MQATWWSKHFRPTAPPRRWATGRSFDILVTDVDMPGTLLRTASFVAASRPNVEIVVTSGRNVSELLPSVSKPASPPRLLGVLSRNLPIAA
jgi:hypothetical protein